MKRILRSTSYVDVYIVVISATTARAHAGWFAKPFLSSLKSTEADSFLARRAFMF